MSYGTKVGPVFTVDDVGCWADGASGHGHIRAVLRSLLIADGWYPRTDETVQSLGGPMPDDAWDEDEALDTLNACCTGCYFTIEGGDLMLVAEGEE